jgi:hypothetical protein
MVLIQLLLPTKTSHEEVVADEWLVQTRRELIE